MTKLTPKDRLTLGTAISVGRFNGTGTADLGGRWYAPAVAKLVAAGFLVSAGGDLYAATDDGLAYAAKHNL